MTVRLHESMGMPKSGRDLSSCDAYWNFDNDTFYGDGDEDDFHSAPMLNCAHLVASARRGTYMISCDNTAAHWRDGMVAALGTEVLQNLPQDREWWEDFAKLLQHAEQDSFEDNARLAFLLEREKYSLSDALVHYKDTIEVLPGAFSSVGAAHEAAVVAFLEETQQTLSDLGYTNASDVFDDFLGNTDIVYPFAGQYVVIHREH